MLCLMNYCVGFQGKFKPTFGGIKRPAVKKEPTDGAGGSQRSDGNMSNEDFLLLMDKVEGTLEAPLVYIMGVCMVNLPE